MSKPKNVEIIPVGDPRRPSWIPAKNDRGYALNVYIDEGCWREERWGQYVLPKYDPNKPDGHDGIGRTWQRATTFIGMAEYAGEGLSDYQIRHALAGLVRRPDLLVKAARLWGLPDKHFMDKDEQDDLKAAWKEIAEEAHDASGGNEASRNGTEVHAAIEHVNRGGTVETLPTEIMIDGVKADLTVWSRHVEAYLDLRDSDDGFEVFPEFVERVVNPDADGTSGKFDILGLYLAPDKLIDTLNTMRPKGTEPLEYWTEPRWVVIDIKGGDTEYREKFSRQLKRYAVAEALWDFERDCYEDMPEGVCQDFGLVVRVPWWEVDPKVELIPIPFGDVAEEGLEACRTVKKARSLRLPKIKSLALGYAPEVVAAEPVEEPAKKASKFRRPKASVEAPVTAAVEAADRLAIAEGRNDDPDDDQPRTAESVAIVVQNLTPLDGEGKPLGELATTSERGCSKCRRKGHRATSPKCLGDADPGFIERPDGVRIERPTQGSANPTGQEPTDADGRTVAAGSAEERGEWCRGHSGGSGWTAPPEGSPEGTPWVCGECGLPSRAGMLDGSGEPLAVSKDRAGRKANEARAERVPDDDQEQEEAPEVEEDDEADDEVFGDNEMTDEEYWLQLLEAAGSRANVISIGKQAREALGALTPALQELGKKKLKQYPKAA